MGFAGAITAFILLLFHAIGALRVYKYAIVNEELQSIFLIGGLILSLVALVGVLFNKRWGWPAVLCVLALGLANAVIMFAAVGSSITIALLLGWTIFAILVAFIAVDLWEPQWVPPPVQSFDDSHDADHHVGQVSTSVGADKRPVVKKTASRKKTSKKKSTNTTASKKKSARKKARKKSTRKR